MSTDWKNNKEKFEMFDVRKATGNFLPGLLKKAGEIEVGSGICVIQTFEPTPLYSAMENLGFEHLTEQGSESEYRVYFYRAEKKGAEFAGSGDMPLKPTAILNFKKIDGPLTDIVVRFWNLTWGKETPAIDLKTKLLLSLANGVGAGRFRQATRELVKAYSIGVTIPELDELFSLLVWNGGIGTFASEIGPSSLFAAYQRIKTLESKGKTREEIMGVLMEDFGEKNPDVKVVR
ncbi:MAG: hypothetical protein U9N73_09545 [Candidatus Auribacterota bacterium]|nr:hypothetical protein [Candidatus Auribacterota bacterium]